MLLLIKHITQFKVNIVRCKGYVYILNSLYL